MTKRILLGLVMGCAVGSALAAEVSSLIYFDYTHDATKYEEEPSKLDRLNSDGKFNLARGYLTVTDKPADNLAYKIQLDAGQVSKFVIGDGDEFFYDSDGDSIGLSLTGKDTGFYAYVKNAMVEWSTAYGRFTVGVQNMNMYSVQEANWGYRMLTAPIMDVCKFSGSADLGVGYYNEYEMFKGSLLVTNGSGYKVNETDKYKKVSLALVAGETALAKKDGWNAGLTFSMEPYKHSSGETESIGVASLFGGWAGMGLRVGAEFDTKTTSAALPGDKDKDEQIIGFYGNYKVPVEMPLDLFAQMYMYDPNEEADDDGLTDVIAGVRFNPAKGMVIAPNLKMTTFESDTKDTQTLFRVNFEFKI